jgi:hypothetical protein
MRIVAIVGLVAALTACESLYDNDGISRIRTQADAVAYNATVSSESQKLICEREAVLGSNIRQFVCLTVAQREYLQQVAQENSRLIFEAGNRTQDPAQ